MRDKRIETNTSSALSNEGIISNASLLDLRLIQFAEQLTLSCLQFVSCWPDSANINAINFNI